MKKFLFSFSVLICPAFCYANSDTLSQQQQARTAINRIKSKSSDAANIRSALTSVVNMSALRIPFITMKELRLGKADSSNVVYVTDEGKQGIFNYDSVDINSLDDSMYVVRVKDRRYKREVSLNQWKGKRIVWTGTSIPWQFAPNSYPEQIGKMLGAKMINSSISGSTIIFKAPIKGGDRGSYGMSGTYKELIAAGFPQNYSYENRILPFSDAELVVIDHGHNDQSRIETDLGTLDGTDKTTFYGAYNTVINAVIAANPKARIILCTPPNGWMHGGEGDASGYKVLLHKVADAIRELGKYRGIPVLDFQANANIHSRNQKVWTTDGVHPNNAATKRLATIGYRFLLTID